jgi:2-polyprenyl-6-hydroxyphenyl methylase/3-demethylubiquinone-9 3-methyltransferase
VEGVQNTVDPAQIERFAAQADAWWNPEGSFAPLHRLNPARLGYLRSRFLDHFGRAPTLRPFAGLSLLDVGCGGGLVAEPMARLGFSVTAIDADERAIDAAQGHAEATGLAIDYRVATAESLALAGDHFHAVVALEIIEHVSDPQVFLDAVAALVGPGGMFVGATLNRTARSFVAAIVGAEYLLHWLPPGTHCWGRFVRPSEYVAGLRRNGLRAADLTGLSYDFASGEWTISRDLSMNYLVAAERPSGNRG